MTCSLYKTNRHTKMKVVVDNKIPYIRETIERIADEVVYLPGKEIDADAIKDEDAIIIRTRTICNESLLKGSKVRFIGTATIGFDHIDTEYCKKAGITWRNCPGCNAGAVEQYVHAILLLLQKEKNIQLSNLCLGIIGVGHVGSHILSMAGRLGMRILLNDPPREDRGENGFVSLDTIADKCNIITFHTPLIKDGKYKTEHLADDRFFNKLKNKPIIINTSRGEVINTKAILKAIDNGKISEAIIDVWENEPNINTELLNKVFIGTPHIAGYSANGKINATRMTLESLCSFFNINTKIEISLPPDPNAPYSSDENIRILEQYNPHNDYNALLKNPEKFEQMRGNYNLRRE